MRKFVQPKLAMVAISLMSMPASATTLLTFDSLSGMVNSPGAAVSLLSQLSDQFLTTNGVRFSSNGGFAAIVDHFPDPSATPSFPNIIGGTSGSGTLDYGAPIIATFFVAANTGQQATTNLVTVLGDRFPAGSGFATLEAYGISGNFLGSVSAPDTGPFGTGLTLSYSGPGIHSVRFFSNNNTVGFDNFEFGDLTGVSGGVPEPASWALMIAGFGLTGAAMRRRAQVLIVTA